MSTMTQELLDKVVELRRRTGAPAMYCRKALASCEGNLEKAEAEVRARNPRDYGMLITTSEGRRGY
jgi:translation elongation factor EF-Ts